jgi:hypothetical protein
MALVLNHYRSDKNTTIKLVRNNKFGNTIVTNLDVPIGFFSQQRIIIPGSEFNTDLIDEINIYSMYAGKFTGLYYVDGIAIEFENEGKIIYSSNEYRTSDNAISMIMINANIEITQQENKYALVMNPGSSKCEINFDFPDYIKEFADKKNITVYLELDHYCTIKSPIVKVRIMQHTIKYSFNKCNKCETTTILIPLEYIDLQKTNTIFIEPVRSDIKNLNDKGKYYIARATLYLKSTANSDEGLKKQSKIKEYIKNWIYVHRRNIKDLDPTYRDDYSLYDFVVTAPSWFYLPYLPISPTELYYLIKYFGINFYSKGYEIKEINEQARSFHIELFGVKGGIIKKNALRHAYWSALLCIKYGDEFARDFSDAHEYAHVDLSIEGQFDHVTDKINNAVGIQIAKEVSNVRDNLVKAIEKAFDDGYLAICSNFRIVKGIQDADVHWQKPISYLKTAPRFVKYELDTLKRKGIFLKKT